MAQHQAVTTTESATPSEVVAEISHVESLSDQRCLSLIEGVA